MQGAAHRSLVAVGLGRVNGAVTYLQGIQNTAFAFFIAYLVDAVAYTGHFDAVV